LQPITFFRAGFLPESTSTMGASPRRRPRIVLFALGVLVAGCGLIGNPLDRFRPVSATMPPPPAPSADDDDHLGWAETEPWFVIVRKHCRTLDVYRYGTRQRSFPAVFGLNGAGSKLYEGDLRTPTGLYMIVDKRHHARWRHFLLLDYPNLQDVHRYWLAMEAGDIPRRGDGYAGPGGAVGIHGTDKPSLNRLGVDWTWGCISLTNDAIEELAGLVPVGTLVLIDD
jgi:murein L,D-transpeptidase YafK